MGQNFTESGWASIDDTESAESFQSYLDTVSGIEAIDSLKRRTDSILESAGVRFLDLGCGNGDDVLALLDRVAPEGAVVGVDSSTAMLAEARDRLGDRPGAAFTVADAETLPFETDTFDGCRADRVLQHLSAPREALSELQRVTRPGGVVAVCEPDWGTLTVDPMPDSARVQPDRVLAPEWSCARNGRIGRKLRRWLSREGLSDLRVDAVTVVVTDFDTADEVFGLTGRLTTLREAGVLRDRSSTRWLRSLQGADRAGSFFSSVSLYTVVGTVPSR